jgi:hypothetical protein
MTIDARGHAEQRRSNKKETVETALRLLIQTHAQTSIRQLRGKVRWEDDSQLPKSPTKNRYIIPCQKNENRLMRRSALEYTRDHFTFGFDSSRMFPKTWRLRDGEACHNKPIFRSVCQCRGKEKEARLTDGLSSNRE